MPYVQHHRESTDDSIGGSLPSTRQKFGEEQDPWISGIGVFDMTEFAAAPYESPDLVKQHYASGYQEPTWSSPTLASVSGKYLLVR